MYVIRGNIDSTLTSHRPVNMASANIRHTGDSKFTMIDLFAGTGAFTLAFEGTGQVECVFANDMSVDSKHIYDKNFHHTLTLKDLNTIPVEEIPSHDILTGGFPCQPFSIAGYREGFRDERSNVFWKILEILKHHLPKVVILENVKNLRSHDDGKTFRIIREQLEGIGYHIKDKVLNTKDITSVPQNRERIYIVGFLEKKYADVFNLEFTPQKTKSIKELLSSTTIPSKYYYNLPKALTRKDSETDDEFTRRNTRWESSMNISKMILDGVIEENKVYQFRRVYVRENRSGVCPTLTANMGGGGHNVPLIRDEKGVRKLTPRECFSFQGFPETYRVDDVGLSDSHLYKLAGNAVSVPVVQLIAERVIKVLQEIH